MVEPAPKATRHPHPGPKKPDGMEEPQDLTPELVEKVVEKVYSLFLRDLELERERYRILNGARFFRD